MKTFLNTVSNVAYVLLGISILNSGGPETLAVALVVLGIGSGLFHAFHLHPSPQVRYVTHLSDEIGMYATFSSTILLIIGITDWDAHLVLWFLAGVMAVLLTSHAALGILGAINFFYIVRDGYFVPYGLVVVALFGLAYFVRSLDRGELGYAHVIWHLMTCVMIGYYYFNVIEKVLI